MNNSTNNNSEWLVRYLDGELEGEEKQKLEQQLATDAVLQEELENLRLVRKAVQHYGLKQKVSGIHSQMMSELKTETPVRQMGNTRRIFRYSIAVAASVLLVYIGIEAYSYFTLSADRVFANNYQPYELTTLRDNGTQHSAIEKAYRERNYSETISLYESLTVKEIESSFLAGMSYIELQQSGKAVEQFRTVLRMNEAAGTTIRKDPAEYYLALTLVKNKDYSSALEIFQKIKNDTNHLYHSKITGKLLRQVKRLRSR